MTKENIIDMLNGHKLISDKLNGEVYWNGGVFCVNDTGTEIPIDHNFVEWVHDGWHRKPEPKMRPMTHDEILGFIAHTPNIVVNKGDSEWVPSQYHEFIYHSSKYRWAYIDEKGNIGEPHKFEVEE